MVCFVIYQTAAEKASVSDQGMQYPAEVGVNAYVRVKLSFLGQQVSAFKSLTASQDFGHLLSHLHRGSYISVFVLLALEGLINP